MVVFSAHFFLDYSHEIGEAPPVGFHSVVVFTPTSNSAQVPGSVPSASFRKSLYERIVFR
jgi:hypothetical protein